MNKNIFKKSVSFVFVNVNCLLNSLWTGGISRPFNVDLWRNFMFRSDGPTAFEQHVIDR